MQTFTEVLNDAGTLSDIEDLAHIFTEDSIYVSIMRDLDSLSDADALDLLDSLDSTTRHIILRKLGA